jgi:aspartate carbamoyltransferase catalytic subunit
MEVASKCDVIYQTRIQRERFGDRVDLYNSARGKYIVDSKVMDVLPKHGVVLHPLPRLDEVSSNSTLLRCVHYLRCLINFGRYVLCLSFGDCLEQDHSG